MLTDPYMGRDVHIGGIVLRGRAPYNEAWNFFIMPGSAFLFDSNPEACNVSPMDLEDRIDELGPMLAWCPWTSRLVREVRVDGQRTGLAR